MKAVSEILKSFQKKEFKALYLLLGKEKYFHDLLLDELSSVLFNDPSSRSLNRIILHGTENSLSEVVNAALSFPMLSEYKIIIVKDFNKIKTSDSGPFLKYLESPQKSSILVLSCQETGKNKIFSKTKEMSIAVDCKPIAEYKVESWLKERLIARGLKSTPTAVAMLSEYTGNNLLTIEQELNKITEYKSDNTEISEDDIIAVTGMSKEYNVFAFQKALGDKNYKKSYIIGKNLIDAGENLNLIVSIIFSFFKKALLYTNNPVDMGSLRISDFQKREISATMKKFDLQGLKKVIQILGKMDQNIKSSAIPDLAIIQTICYNICKN